MHYDMLKKDLRGGQRFWMKEIVEENPKAFSGTRLVTIPARNCYRFVIDFSVFWPESGTVPSTSCPPEPEPAMRLMGDNMEQNVFVYQIVIHRFDPQRDLGKRTITSENKY